MQKVSFKKGVITVTAAKYIILALFILALIGLGIFYAVVQKSVTTGCLGDTCASGDLSLDVFSRNKPTYSTSTNTQTVTLESIVQKSPFGVFSAFTAEAFAPFIEKNNMTISTYMDWADNHMRNLGAYWTRSNMQLLWDDIEPTIGAGYNWDNEMISDTIVKRIYESNGNLNWLGVFHDGGGNQTGVSPKGRKPLRNPLNYEKEFSAFVKAAVERYDGDGYADASSKVKVKYWQVANEVMTWEKSGKNVTDYVNMVRMVSKAVKSADPEAKIVLLAPTDARKTDEFLVKVINDLASEKMFDVIDVHQWGQASTWKMAAVSEYRALLDSKGLKNVEIWSAENGTWNGKPRMAPVVQTESDQASSLVKRYVYNLANGLDKLMWTNLVEWENYNDDTSSVYNSMGLVADGVGAGEDTTMNNIPRLSYYTYKLMTTKLEGTDWDKIEKISESDNIYAYSYPKTNGKNVWVLWWEDQYSTASEYTISFVAENMKEVVITRALPRFISGKNVTDFNSAFEYMKVPVIDGKISFKLIPGEGPIYIEDSAKANIVGVKVSAISAAADYNRADQLLTMLQANNTQTPVQNTKPGTINTTKLPAGGATTNPKCGDGVCDAMEMKNKALCPGDCR